MPARADDDGQVTIQTTASVAEPAPGLTPRAGGLSLGQLRRVHGATAVVLLGLLGIGVYSCSRA